MLHLMTKKILYNYRIVAQKRPKGIAQKGIKQLTLDLFGHVHYSNFFSFSSDHMHFVQFRPYAASFPELLSLTIMLKSKKTWEMSLDLTPSLKTSIDRCRKGRGSFFERALFVKLALWFYSK